jgi:quercetin dioxygenase-like cupin family protein
MFNKSSGDGYLDPIKGIRQKTLVYGEKTLMTEFKLKKGSEIPRHCHPYEQTGYLITGKIRLFVGSEEFECKPGDSWCIPSDEEHGADVSEDSIVVEVFSPVREDYLPNT